VRILDGTSEAEAVAGWLERVAGGLPLVLDVGTGDGRFPYEMARRDAGSFYLGMDPDGESMKEYAYRASRKASRGGVENAAYVVASIEWPPAELLGKADRVHVNFPWGALLRGVLRPERAVLEGLAGVARAGAAIELLITYDPGHDHGATGGAPLAAPSLAYIDEGLAPAYAAAGIEVGGRRLVAREEALAVPSTWGRRLLRGGRPREVFAVAARRVDARAPVRLGAEG
jgi:16S rRNA (adenine(1408)-N(1))-methyltransferase